MAHLGQTQTLPLGLLKSKQHTGMSVSINFFYWPIKFLIHVCMHVIERVPVVRQDVAGC